VSLDEAILILSDLSVPGGLYRNVATEMLVAVELERGNVDVALALLQSHIQDTEASQAQVQRMGELIVALGSKPELATQFGSGIED
jgi:predicted negative regulator of RcsB-dependent stress response